MSKSDHRLCNIEQLLCKLVQITDAKQRLPEFTMRLPCTACKSNVDWVLGAMTIVSPGPRNDAWIQDWHAGCKNDRRGLRQCLNCRQSRNTHHGFTKKSDRGKGKPAFQPRSQAVPRRSARAPPEKPEPFASSVRLNNCQSSALEAKNQKKPAQTEPNTA
jgi:hypothetical protein